MKKRKAIFILLLFVLGLVFILPIELPYSFRAKGKIYPLRKWELRIDEGVGFQAKEVDVLSGKVERLTQFKFDENDIGSYNPLKTFENISRINKYDTLACFYSYALEEQVRTLRNELFEKKLLLKRALSGEKRSILNQLDAELEKVGNEVKLAQKEYERAQILFCDSIISCSEFDASFYKLKMLEAKQKEAKFALKSALTGMKSEEIDYIQGVISGIEDRLSVTEKQKAELCVRAPFSGELSFSKEQGQYLLLEDTDSLLLAIPVRYRDNDYVKLDHQIYFTQEGSTEEYNAQIIEKGKSIYTIQNEQVIFVKALVKKGKDRLKTGLLVSGRFECDEVPLYVYLGRTMEVFLD